MSTETGGGATRTDASPGAKKARPEPLDTWLPVHASSHFSIHNIPFGVFSSGNQAEPHCATRLGDTVVDLAVLAASGLLTCPGFSEEDARSLQSSSLNDFMALGRPKWRAARVRLQTLLSSRSDELKDNAGVREEAFVNASEVRMHLPAHIGDYTDFYSSREHATNVGTMFRGAENALQPNWLHLPVGYHGRASSVVVSGTPVRRPRGQLQKDAKDPKQGSVFGPCRLMDFEVEIGAFVGTGNTLGEPININEAQDHIFGLVLMNDWSARDIQKWEYVPLGPFTAKNVATSISPWIVTLDALEQFRCETSAGTQSDPQPLPYLRDPNYGSYDINLAVGIAAPGMKAPHFFSKTNFRYLYWSVEQQLTHHTVTGCNMRPGDLLGSGTISGTEPNSFGSMLELSWKGSRVVDAGPAGERKFLKDGDNVVMTGYCQGDGYIVGFGDVNGTLLPAHQ